MASDGSLHQVLAFRGLAAALAKPALLALHRRMRVERERQRREREKRVLEERRKKLELERREAERVQRMAEREAARVSREAAKLAKRVEHDEERRYEKGAHREATRRAQAVVCRALRRFAGGGAAG